MYGFACPIHRYRALITRRIGREFHPCVATKFDPAQSNVRAGASDRYVLACYRYIELNRLRASMVAQPAGCAWSSYGANAFGRNDARVQPPRCVARIGRHARGAS